MTSSVISTYPPLEIGYWEHLSVFGHTRAGKSVAIRHLIHLLALGAEANRHPTYQIFVLWTKLERKPLFAKRYFPGTSYAEVSKVKEVLKPRARVVVYKPQFREKNEAGYDEFFSTLYWRAEKTKRPSTIVVDESNAVTDYRANGGPLSYRKCFTEGEGLEMGMIVGIQDPVFLQREMLSQADHIMVFREQRNRDRQLLSDEIGYKLPKRFPDKHGFFYFRSDIDPVYYPDIQTATRREVIL